MREKSIARPACKLRLAIIHEWALEYCRGDACAAMLIAFFEYWHDIKLAQRGKGIHANKVAEKHGDEGTQDTSLYQYHTEQELEDGIMVFKRKRIREAIKLLVRLDTIEIHKNPNPKYSFDQTRYFLFKPTMINLFLAQRYPAPQEDDYPGQVDEETPSIDTGPDEVHRPRARGKKAARRGKPAATRALSSPMIDVSKPPTPQQSQTKTREERLDWACAEYKSRIPLDAAPEQFAHWLDEAGEEFEAENIAWHRIVDTGASWGAAYLTGKSGGWDGAYPGWLFQHRAELVAGGKYDRPRKPRKKHAKPELPLSEREWESMTIEEREAERAGVLDNLRPSPYVTAAE